MPGMNVRGDEYLNFTREEAAAWLGGAEPHYYAPVGHAHVVPNDAGGFTWVLVVLSIGVLFLILCAAFSRSTQSQISSKASRTSVQPNNAVITPPTAAERRSEAISENVPPPIAPSQNTPAPVAYLPSGWFYGRMQGALPLRNKEGRSMGAVPDGTTFFGTTEASPVHIIVAADGSFWGYVQLTVPPNVAASRIPIIPAFEKAARLIGQIEAFGITEALYTYNRQEPEEAYLPAAWSKGRVAEDLPLTESINGARIGTIPKDTLLLYQIANVGNWRLVVAADGSFWGYTCIRPLNGVPERSFMRPEFAKGVTLMHRLENGSTPGERLDHIAENTQASVPYDAD